MSGDMKIGARLGLGFGLVVAVLLVVAIAGYWGMHSLGGTVTLLAVTLAAALLAVRLLRFSRWVATPVRVAARRRGSLPPAENGPGGGDDR